MRYEMSKQEARKVTIVEELLAGHLTNAQAAELLDLSVRQIQRLKVEATAHGVMSVLHHSRGVKPANALDPKVAQKLVEIYETELAGYNFCHATDVLAEEKGVFVSVSTTSRYLKAKGVRSPQAKRRPKKHRSRDARSREGELVQMDASPFDWLGTGSRLHLHGALDDATGRVLALCLAEEETLEGYSELMFQMNHDAHLPREIYTDGRTIFVYDSLKKQQLTLAEELAGQPERLPNFARALRDLHILLIIARSAQAKGGIERLWGTLQDRLPKDFKRKGITSLDQANVFLRHYMAYYNRKFAVQAACPGKAYLPRQSLPAMQLLFAKHEIRKLDSGLSFSFYGQKYVLPHAVHDKKIPASPHDTLTVATSSHIGMQVIFKGLVFEPILLKPKPKSSLVQAFPPRKALVCAGSDPLPVIPLHPALHPWRRHTTMFYSDRG
jgi:transposase